MTPANRTKLQKASRELAELSKCNSRTQDVMLSILRTQELLHLVLTDLCFRPEVNDGRTHWKEDT